LLESSNERLRGKIKNLLFPPRKPPNWSALDRGSKDYQIGSFSQLFDRALGGYEPLPDWAPDDELPDSSVRNVSVDGKQIEAAGDENEDADDKGVLDFDDFFRDGDEGDAEEEQAEEEQAYYSDEPDDEYQASGRDPQPTAKHGQNSDEEDGGRDDDLDDFFD
jgi:AP-3 complex subunit beta